MKTSKIQLESYSIPPYLYFPTRVDRDTYYISVGTPVTGTYCAVAEDSNVDTTDMNSALWYLEVFNGTNWTLASIDDSFALVVTNDGLRALTYIQENPASYKMIISKVALRKVPFTASGTSPINYTDTFFRYNSLMPGNNPDLRVLDTSSEADNPTFTMHNNVSYRINMANGGIQYIISLDTDTLGMDYASSNPVPLSSYNVGAVGLYIKDPQNPGNDILFATANITNTIYKYATTATNTGNTVKLYLNTTLTNLGYVSDLTVMPEDTGSIPEVVTDADLPRIWNGTTAPRNIFLVDNFYDTGVPALAVRNGDPALNQQIEWTYFTPNSNTIRVNSSLIDSSVKNYMAVYFNSGTGKYVPATGSSIVQGIILGIGTEYAAIMTSGTITNATLPYKYNVSIVNSGTGYAIDDYFEYTNSGVTFLIRVLSVTGQGAIMSIASTPIYGASNISISNASPSVSHTANGANFRFNITSQSVSGTYITWNFPSSDLNRPLYIDSSHPGELSSTVSPSSSIVGWCIGVGLGTSAIKLNIDMNPEHASESIYGTVRYATSNEVQKGQATSGNNTTVVTPEKLQANYLQKTLVSGEPGESAANPVVVDSNVKFTKQIVSTVNGVGFQGIAYRAEWADLAEYYESDRVYLPGTLVTIGLGEKEITLAKEECNGIISTKPGFILGDKKSDYDLPVALVGKVPVMFSKDSKIHFGDRVYLSKTEPGKASVIPNGKCLGKIIDKSENLNKKSTIMCSIRINF